MINVLAVAATAWKMSKYGVFSALYFPAFGLNTKRYFLSLSVFSPNAGKYGPEKTPYLGTFNFPKKPKRWKIFWHVDYFENQIYK